MHSLTYLFVTSKLNPRVIFVKKNRIEKAGIPGKIGGWVECFTSVRAMSVLPPRFGGK
jgi:hypothetical protein